MSKKTYKVVGSFPVLGTPPGEELQADLDEAHESYLLEAGHLEVVGDQPTGKPKKGSD